MNAGPNRRRRRRASRSPRRHAAGGGAARGSTIGKAIGKYRILAAVGSGGMGAVYKAIDTTLDREVAIKVLHRERADPHLVDRFHAEAMTLARLNHPQIAIIYELFRSRHDLLLVMEFVRGETLESVCGRLGVLAPSDAAALADKILSALEHAHSVNVIHCDVKPANVMLTEGGGIKIMDFGTARVRGAAARIASYTVGTPAYMSPEQLLGDDVDARADVYAVGVVLYRLLTGALPFDGETALAVAQQHVGDPPAPMQTHRPGLPDWCDAIVRRALAKSPADRFQSAREFREALRRATGLSAADLAQPCAIAVRPSDAPLVRVPPARHRVTSPPARIASTIVLHAASTGRAVAVGSFAAALIVFAAALITALLRMPVAAAQPPVAPSAPPVVLHAKALDAARKRLPATIELAAERIVMTANDTNRVLHDIRYDDIVSVDYSPGAASSRDRVTLRTTKPRSEVIVLRFDAEADASRAAAAIEERLPTAPARETRESTR